MRLDLELLGAQEFDECSSEAVVAEGVEHGVDGRIDPQEPEGGLVPVVRDAVAMASSSDDHEEGVWCPANPKNAYKNR